MTSFATFLRRPSRRKVSATVLAGLVSVNAVLASWPAAAFDNTNPNDFSIGAIQQRQRDQMLQQMQEHQERREREEREARFGGGQAPGPGSAMGMVVIGLGLALGACAMAGCFRSSKPSEPAQTASPPPGEPHPPSPPPARVAAPQPAVTYRVVRVPRHDVLNMRHLPAGEIIGAIPPQGRGVTLGDCAFDSQGLTWCLATYGSQRGWVATAYLRPE